MNACRLLLETLSSLAGKGMNHIQRYVDIRDISVLQGGVAGQHMALRWYTMKNVNELDIDMDVNLIVHHPMLLFSEDVDGHLVVVLQRAAAGVRLHERIEVLSSLHDAGVLEVLAAVHVVLDADADDQVVRILLQRAASLVRLHDTVAERLDVVVPVAMSILLAVDVDDVVLRSKLRVGLLVLRHAASLVRLLHLEVERRILHL
jgi:hypothetical protein